MPPPPMPWDVLSHYPGMSPGHGGGTWIPKSSSNVDAFRWLIGAEYPLQVRFKDKHKGLGRAYEYKVPEHVYDQFFDAASPGRFVYYVLRLGGFPYREITGTAAAGDYPPGYVTMPGFDNLPPGPAAGLPEL